MAVRRLNFAGKEKWDEQVFWIAVSHEEASAAFHRRSSTQADQGRYSYEAPIGYVSQPKQDKRNKDFVAAEVQRGSPGISTIFLPCEVLREYFYRLPRTSDRADFRPV